MLSRIALVVSLVALGLAAAAARNARAEELSPYPFMHDGLDREVWLQVPTQAPRAMVVLLHGGGGRADRVTRGDRGRLAALAARDQVLLVMPQGIDRSWNDGRGSERIAAQRQKVDDVGFLRALIEDLQAGYQVPAGRVFLTGISNGGMMSFRMACEAADLVTAIAPVAANLSGDPADCRPSEPVGVLIMDGLEDPLVPYQGGQVTVFGKPRGAVASAPASAAHFAAASGCDPEPAGGRMPDVAPWDGTWTQVQRYRGCAEDGPVTLLSVHGGGHTWPGGAQYLPAFLVGKTSRDFSGSDVMWRFFRRLGE